MTFDWTREVPAAWQADLDRLCPGENVTRLMLSWLSGSDPEEDRVQRWIVHEVLPASAVLKILGEEEALEIHQSLTRGIWDALHGPDPRTLGKWIPKDTGGTRWVSKSLVSRNAWDLHKQTGGLPLLCWIIEGNHGGHSWQFGPFEQGFLLAAGVDPALVQVMEEAWPNPGSQPYADYDNRVFTALADRDLLAKWRQGLAWDNRANRANAGLILANESTARRTDMLERVMRWLDHQIGEAVSDIPRTMLPDLSAFTPVDQPYEGEAQLHSYLTES